MRNKLAIYFRSAILLLFLIASSVRISAQNNVIDEIVWVVGDEVILKSDVEDLRLNYLYRGIPIQGNPYCVIPEQIAIQKLYLNQAKIDTIEVSESAVIRMVDQQMAENLQIFGSKDKMEETMNKTTTQIRRELRNNIREGQIAMMVQNNLVGDIAVTPAEVRRFFQNLSQDSIPYIPTKVEVQIITQNPKISLAELDYIKKRLREYTEQVHSGEMSFSTLARLYSEDPGSAMKGGEIGFTGRGALAPEYANVAFNLQDPNKVSKIVETEFGFHIIQLIEKRGDRINTRHILLRPKVSEEDKNIAMNRLDSIANDIRDEKFSFEEGALFLSDHKETKNNGGLLPNPYDNTSKFEMQMLPPEIGKVVEKMNVGDISNAFTWIDESTGKEVCSIVRLKKRISGHKATITEDYQSLREMVENKKKQEILDDWIRKKQKETYIRINEEWKDCEFQYPGWIKD